MNIPDLLHHSAKLKSPSISGIPHVAPRPETAYESRIRLLAGVASGVVCAVVFAKALYSLALHAAASNLHSHILLIPLICGYLIYIRREQLPARQRSARMAAVAIVVSLTVVGVAFFLKGHRNISNNDYLALMAFGFVSYMWSAGLFFLGRKWMWEAAFPAAFLLFIIPLPDRAVDLLETGSKLASAEAANLFFELTGTPILRDGTIFQLPGIVLEVAQECSGIRSSWVLFITSILASNIFLKSQWRRAALVVFVIPLGIIRNGLRILVIGLLCVHVGPHMIHSVIHRRGGPLFFALSLVPLFLFLWWLRRGEPRRHPAQISSGDPVLAITRTPGPSNEADQRLKGKDCLS